MAGVLPFTALFLLLSVELSATIDPGVKLRITQKGVDYANQVAINDLKKGLLRKGIKNLASKNNKYSYEIKNIDVASVTVPDSKIQLEPDSNGAKWYMWDMGIDFTADYGVEYSGWIKITNSGSVKASFSQVSVAESVSFGYDPHSGRPTISHIKCWGSIGNVDIKFFGEWSWIINWFRFKIGKKMREALQPMICEKIKEMIREQTVPAFQEMKVKTAFGQHFVVDYSLVQKPTITPSYVEICDKGEVFSALDSVPAPYSPQPVPDYGDDDKMLYIWVTQYSFNSLLFQAHRTGLLNHTFIGAQMNELARPAIDLVLHSVSTPTTSLTADKFVVNVDVYAAFRERSADDSVNDLYSLNASLSFTFAPRIVSKNITGEITDYNVTVSDVRFLNGGAFDTPANVQADISRYLGDKVIPMINAVGSKGVELPVLGKMRFRNAFLKVQEGFVVVGTDAEKTWD